MARWTPEQLAYVNNPKLLFEMATWVLTNRKAGPAQRKILEYAGLGYNRKPHDLMVSYVHGCIWRAQAYGKHPDNTVACQLIDEHIAYTTKADR